MRKCLVPGCGNSQIPNQKLQGITFHRFPKSEIRSIEWLHAIGLKHWFPISKHAVVCSLHFPEDSFDRSSACGLVRLRENAIPNTQRNMRAVDGTNEKITINVNIISNESVLPSTSNTCPMQTSRQTLQTENLDKFTQTSETFYMDIICRQKLIAEVMRLNTLYKSALRELRNTRKKQIRRARKVATLKNILAYLRKTKLLNQDNLNALSNITVTSEELKQLRTRKYSPCLQKFAIMLHFYSPKAYNYVHSVFKTGVPHPRVVSKWYSTLDFTKEAFEDIKIRNHNEQLTESDSAPKSTNSQSKEVKEETSPCKVLQESTTIAKTNESVIEKQVPKKRKDPSNININEFDSTSEEPDTENNSSLQMKKRKYTRSFSDKFKGKHLQKSSGDKNLLIEEKDIVRSFLPVFDNTRQSCDENKDDDLMNEQLTISNKNLKVAITDCMNTPKKLTEVNRSRNSIKPQELDVRYALVECDSARDRLEVPQLENFDFNALVRSLKAVKLPASNWKIRVVVSRQKKITEVTFTNKEVNERYIKFSKTITGHIISFDKSVVRLLGAPSNISSFSDVSILLDIIHNISPDDPVLEYSTNNQ